jgi:hypothetical protein
MKNLSRLILTLAAAAHSHAALSFDLPGNRENADWSELTSARHSPPAYPSFGNYTDDWSMPIAANEGSDGAAALNKLGGGGFPSSTSIYSFFTPGTFAVTQQDPLADLATVIWQIDHSVPFLAEPVLNFNGESQGLPPTFVSRQRGNFSGTGPIGPFTTTLAAYQWDLSGISGDVDRYEIVWQGGLHQSIFTMRTDEADQFAQVVPEPSLTLLSLGSLAFLLRRRR